jgi:hypothetical protein
VRTGSGSVGLGVPCRSDFTDSATAQADATNMAGEVGFVARSPSRTGLLEREKTAEEAPQMIARTGEFGFKPPLFASKGQTGLALGGPSAGADPKQEADQAREAQRARLQAVRMLLWNHAGDEPIKAAEALIKLEAREARLLGLDMPTKVAVIDPDGGIPLKTIRTGDGAGGSADGGCYAGTGTAAARP